MTAPCLRTVLRRLLRRHNYDVGVRYFPVARAIRRADRQQRWRILDVGSGASGIATFLPGFWVAGLDRQIDSGMPRALPLVKGSATALPFRDASLDAVTCVDVIEHLAPAQRRLVLAETLRVARRLVVISFPSGPGARAADQRMADAYAARHLPRPEWLVEHLEREHPEIDSICAELERLRSVGCPLDYRVAHNERLRLLRIHRMLATRSLLAYRVMNFLCALALPVLSRELRPGAGYRCIVFVSLSHGTKPAGGAGT